MKSGFWKQHPKDNLKWEMLLKLLYNMCPTNMFGRKFKIGYK